MTDTRSLLTGSDDYPEWRAAYVRAVMGAGPVPQLPAVLPLWELLDEARETVGTRPLSEAGAKPRPTPGSVVLADLDRLTALGGDALTTWVRTCMEERAAEGITDLAPEDTDEAKCSWIASRLDWVDSQLWADELHAEIRGLHGRLRAICVIHTRPVWTCGICGDIADEQPGGEWMLCRSGHQVPGRAVMRRDIAKQRLTSRQLRDVYGIAPGTLRRWKHEGWVKPAGRIQHQDLWSAWDVLAVRHALAMGEPPQSA